MCNKKKCKEKTAGTKWEYLEITGDLLPFTVFVLSQGFLVSSGKQSEEIKYSFSIHCVVCMRKVQAPGNSSQLLGILLFLLHCFSSFTLSYLLYSSVNASSESILKSHWSHRHCKCHLILNPAERRSAYTL